MHKIEMWVQGACFPNPGKGAYAVLLRFGEHEKFISGALEGEQCSAAAEREAREGEA